MGGGGGTANPCRSLGVARPPIPKPAARKLLAFQEPGCRASPRISCLDFALRGEGRGGSRVRATQYTGRNHRDSGHGGGRRPTCPREGGARAKQPSPTSRSGQLPARSRRTLRGGFQTFRSGSGSRECAPARVGGAALPEVPEASGWRAAQRSGMQSSPVWYGFGCRGRAQSVLLASLRGRVPFRAAIPRWKGRRSRRGPWPLPQLEREESLAGLRAKASVPFPQGRGGWTGF